MERDDLRRRPHQPLAPTTVRRRQEPGGVARCGSDDPSVGSWDLDKSGGLPPHGIPHGTPHGTLESFRVTASLLVTPIISRRNVASRCHPNQFLSQAETQLGQHHQTRVSTRSSQVSRSRFVCRPDFHGRRCTAITLSRSFFIRRKEQSEFPIRFVIGSRGRSSTTPVVRVWDPEGREYIDMLSAYS